VNLSAVFSICLIVPTGDGNSVIVVPSCEEDVWAWLHTLRTDADLSSLEQIQNAAKVEREKYQRESPERENPEREGMGGLCRSPSPLAGLRPATGAAHPQKTKNRRPEK
jgi:hypothetical protein